MFRGDHTVVEASSAAKTAAANQNVFVIPAQRRSRLASELRSIGADRLAIMRISSAAVGFVEFVAVLCRTVMDEDGTDLIERLSTTMEALEGHLGLDNLPELTEAQMTAAVEHITRAETRKFYRQLLGAAAYDRLAQAVKDDSAAVLAAMRRGLTLVRPMVVAFQDSLAVLTPHQIAAMGLGTPETPAPSFVKLMLQIDTLVTHLLDAVERDALDRLFPEGDATLDAETILQVVEEIRPLISQDLQSRLSAVNDALTRKVRGARDALDHSADGPAQAASSLVELIDQALRTQLKGVDVVSWVQTKYPGRTRDLVYTKNGIQRPAKRAEVLCLVYGPDSHPSQVDPFREAAAASLVTARRALEKVKHEDADPVSDRAVVEAMMQAVQGALGLTFRFAALRLSTTDLDAAAHALEAPQPYADDLSA